MKVQGGVALILVLWLVALISLMATSFGLGIRREASLAAIQVQQAAMLGACEAGVNYAAYRVGHPDAGIQWPADGRLRHWRWDGIDLRIRAFSESGKVDLNHAGPALIQALLRLAGADETELAALTDAILDWRDGDRLRRTNGAELPDYVAAGLTYGPSDRPFQSIDEVSMVLGMRPAVFNALLPWVTTYGGQKGINPNVAPAELLRALPEIDPQRVEHFIQARGYRQTGNNEQEMPVSLPSVTDIPFQRQVSHTYTFLVQARSQGKILSLYTISRIAQDRLVHLFWRKGVPNSLFEDAGGETVDEESPGGAKRPRRARSPAAMTR